METLYIALIIICLYLVFTPVAREQVAGVLRKIYSPPPRAPRAKKVTNNGMMMDVAYGLAEEQARLYNNIPIPPTGVPTGYSFKRGNIVL